MCSRVTTVVSGSFACVLIPAWSIQGTDLEVWCRGIHKEELLKYPHFFLWKGDQDKTFKTTVQVTFKKCQLKKCWFKKCLCQVEEVLV